MNGYCYSYKKYKKVRFSEIVYVILIPKSKEFSKFNLWWQEHDYNNAIISAKNEIGQLIKIHPYMEINQAKRLLYQPNNISYNESNFD